MFIRLIRERGSFAAGTVKFGLTGSVSLALILGILTATGCGKHSESKPKEIAVYCAASMADAMEEAAVIFAGKTGVKVSFEFGSSGSLARKIEIGAPVDVFVSADKKWIDYIMEKKLLEPESQLLFARTRLVCVEQAATASGITSPADLPKASKISIGDPSHVPAGMYAQEALTYFKLWDELLANQQLVMAFNVRAALTAVEQGGAQLAIVFKPDALLSDKVKIDFDFPPESHDPISYHAGVLSSSAKKPEAQAFVNFFSGEEFRQLLDKYGFEMP